jgi:hypothetical protein
MTKRIVLTDTSEIVGYRDIIHFSSEQTRLQIAELSGNVDSLEFLYRMKFEALGHDPLVLERKLNLIEQLNQTFTYLASFRAAEVLFDQHKDISSLTMNLGTKSGWDIETQDGGGLVAEVFAAVTPENNRKLSKDIERVASSHAKHRYVFFMCPGYKAGKYFSRRSTKGVVVLSLGCVP